jgi:hypothetical protein
MPDHEDKSPTEKLAELVRQKAEAAKGRPAPGAGRRGASERAAAALSASKAKPAMRKG